MRSEAITLLLLLLLLTSACGIQDFKTGWLTFSSPRAMFIAQLSGMVSDLLSSTAAEDHQTAELRKTHRPVHASLRRCASGCTGRASRWASLTPTVRPA